MCFDIVVLALHESKDAFRDRCRSRVPRSAKVCVFNSACRLRGQGFAVKLIDEAHHTEGEGFFTNIMRHQAATSHRAPFSCYDF